MGLQFAFIHFLYDSGKLSGEKYKPEDYRLRIALFEAVQASRGKGFAFGRQLSNPIVLTLDIK